ncbi:fatty acid hydroxylase superfamily-domain-containing protein [Spinellus fusiger]|nr:fatty acid hydroxylase superfamily-domain-containing protein [Spinellus fusiger]
MSTTQFVISSLKECLQRSPWSDELLAVWVPIAFYWVYSTGFHFLQKAEIPFIEQYRIHTSSDMEKRNRVTVGRVVFMVAFQQVIQIILAVVLLQPGDPEMLIVKQEKTLGMLTSGTLRVLGLFTHSQSLFPIARQLASFIYWGVVPVFQFFVAMFILDTHQYFLHRLFHTNKFLYRHIHSHHHRLYVPFAFGAMYNHPIEGFMLDSVGAAFASKVARMSPHLCMLFYAFSTLKTAMTVDDHCGYAFPWDPLQRFFGNNVEYHDIHHQPYGIKKNFSQPFFTIWDYILGTELSVQEVKAKAAQKAAQKAE